MSQREKPQSPSALAWLATMKAKSGGGHYSGGEVENFEAGWIVVGFGKAHFLRADGPDLVHSECGRDWLRPKQIFAAGKWPRCKNCERRLERVGQSPV